MANPAEKVDMIDCTKNSSTRPSLDLYYQHTFNKKQLLILNVVGTYNREKSRRLYEESLQDEVLTGVHNDVRGNKWGAYDYQPDAIMEEKYQEDDKIVQTWDNQKDWQKLSGRVILRVGPIKDRLQLSFTGGVNHYMSHGNTYSHTYSNWYCDAQASFNYKQYSFYWQFNTNWNNFWGETLSGGENNQILGVNYTHKTLRVGIGAFNPFTNYKQNKVLTENWNEYASYNFSFGRKFKAGKQRVINSDNDSGVMTSGK